MTIAEESTSWPGVTQPTHLGGLGFGLKWNMGWMNDSLRYLQQEPIYRQYHHDKLTFALMYAWVRTSCSRSVTTKWFTARDPCFARFLATAGSSLRRFVRSWHTCGLTPETTALHGPGVRPRRRMERRART